MFSLSADHVLMLAAIAAAFCWLSLIVSWLSGGSQRQSLLVPLLLAVWIATFALRDSVVLSSRISGVTINALDVLSLVMLIVGIVRAVSLGIGWSGRDFVLILLLLLTLHIARGALDVGVQTAVVDTRGWFYFVAALVYAATIPMRQARRTWILITVSGVLLMVVAVPYLLIEGIHPATQEIYRNGELTTARPIVATGALVILQCAVLALGLGWPSRRAAVRIAIAAGIVVLLLEHRTLWVAGLAVGLTVLFWWFKERSRSRSFAAFGVTGLVLLILPLAVWGASQSQALTASFNEATTSNSTFTWRTTSWQELISSHHSVSQLVYGAPAGASWPRLINGQVVTASPHDGFVDAYLRFGLPGLSVLCALGLLLWRRRTAIAAGTGLTADAIGLLLLTQLVFSIAYTLDPVQGIIDGLLVSGLAAARTVQAPVLRQSRPTGLEYDLAEL